MRDIKFRGKRVDNGEWVYGSLAYIESRAFIFPDDAYVTRFQHGADDLLVILSPIEVLPKTVGQFTGLLDKNSVEIYEGDVVTCEDFNTMNYSVLFQGGAFGYVNRYGGLEWLWIDDETGASDLEVIGNIHDNPEFLKGKE